MSEYARFPCLPDDAKHEDGTPVLNRHSTFITRGHDFPAAKVSYNSVYQSSSSQISRLCCTVQESRTQRQ